MTYPPQIQLGELEQAIMEVVWRRSPLSVKEVGEVLMPRSLAYTTVMTTLDRLYKKGLLLREKRSHAFLYRPAIDRESFERRMVARVLSALSGTSRQALLSGFLDFASTDQAGLDALEQLIAERKRGET